MKIVCRKCGTEASSKCPAMRSIFPSRESERESHFWFGMGYETKEVKPNTGWKPGTLQLVVSMISEKEWSEEEALEYFIKKIKRIPDDQLQRYICKHEYKHTEDCLYCNFKVTA